jgi:hypothetical protein
MKGWENMNDPIYFSNDDRKRIYELEAEVARLQELLASQTNVAEGGGVMPVMRSFQLNGLRVICDKNMPDDMVMIGEKLFKIVSGNDA